MNQVIRGLVVYLFLFLIFRISGKKSISEATTFDVVLLLIISEVTQQALVGEDFSITGSFILITTLIAIDLLFVLLKFKFQKFGKFSEGTPLVIVSKGIVLEKRMKLAQVQEDDVLEAARFNHGIGTMHDIEYAVLEKDGSISIIPKKEKS